MYGLDVDLSGPDPALTARSWRWLLVRVFGLLNDPRSRLAAVLQPEPDHDPMGGPHVPEHR